MSIIFTKVPYIIAPGGGGGATIEDTCTGAVRSDDMNSLDSVLWYEDDTYPLMQFSGGGWTTDTPGTNYYRQLDGDGKFQLSGNISICIAFQVNAVHYSVDADAWDCLIGIYFSEGFKASTIQGWLKVQTDIESDPNPGQLKYEVAGTGNGAQKWTSPPAGSTSGYHVFRIDVDADADTATLYVWNPTLTRWEWNGDTGGYVATGFDSNITDVYIRCQSGSANDYIDVSCDYFRINSGSLITD